MLDVECDDGHSIVRINHGWYLGIFKLNEELAVVSDPKSSSGHESGCPLLLSLLQPDCRYHQQSQTHQYDDEH